jgi:hypothetical protein
MRVRLGEEMRSNLEKGVGAKLAYTRVNNLGYSRQGKGMLLF